LLLDYICIEIWIEDHMEIGSAKATFGPAELFKAQFQDWEYCLYV